MAAFANPLIANLPENVASLSVSRNAWNGVSVEVSQWRGAGTVSHPFPHERDTRLFALLEEIGSPVEPRLRQHQPCRAGYTPRHMDFLPAGLDVWGFSQDVRFVRDAALLIDLAALEERLAVRFDRDLTSAPRLRFQDDRIWPLMKLLADVVDDPDPSAQLYGDGLIAAIAARLFLGPQAPLVDRHGLAPWQVRRVIDFIKAHLCEHIELADLAAMVGLSQSHFSRLFKVSTGMPPYRWQLNARVRRAQALLLDTSASLEDVAAITGFADAVHFGRTFRKLVGATPAAWRNDRKGLL